MHCHLEHSTKVKNRKSTEQVARDYRQGWVQWNPVNALPSLKNNLLSTLLSPRLESNLSTCPHRGQSDGAFGGCIVYCDWCCQRRSLEPRVVEPSRCFGPLEPTIRLTAQSRQEPLEPCSKLPKTQRCQMGLNLLKNIIKHSLEVPTANLNAYFHTLLSTAILRGFFVIGKRDKHG